MGVDDWGRGTHGRGGFGSYKAISHISQKTLGPSVALFWSGVDLESEQDKPGWTWEQWWAYESKLWVGPISGTVEVPEVPHGSFLSIASFFPLHPPPEPSQLSFHTFFCPGSDLTWPCPNLYWNDDCEDEMPKALSCF